MDCYPRHVRSNLIQSMPPVRTKFPDDTRRDMKPMTYDHQGEDGKVTPKVLDLSLIAKFTTY